MSQEIIIPVDLEAERICIGACLTNWTSLELIFDKLDDSAFNDARHKILFGVFMECYLAGEKPNYKGVIQLLEQKGLLHSAGGAEYIINLEIKAHCAQTGIYIKRLEEARTRRSTIYLGKRLIEAGNGDIGEHLTYASQALSKIYSHSVPEPKSTLEIVENFRDGLSITEYFSKKREDRLDGKSTLSGLPTGWIKFDESHDGFDKQQLVIVGARPSVGKSEFMIQCMAGMARKRVKSLYFSLEMTAEQIVARVLGIVTGIQASRLYSGTITAEENDRLHYSMPQIKEIIPYINIDACGMLTADQIQAKARSQKSSAEIEIVYVDHLSKIAAPHSGSKLYETVTHNSAAMKTMAQLLDVPVVLAAQLNRDSTKKENKIPTMAELRDSGHVEQDADKIILLHRNDYYDENIQPGVIDVIFAKNREHFLGTIKFGYNKEEQRMYEMDPLKKVVEKTEEDNKKGWYND